jgi:hypothetical protein
MTVKITPAVQLSSRLVEHDAVLGQISSAFGLCGWGSFEPGLDALTSILLLLPIFYEIVSGLVARPAFVRD